MDTPALYAELTNKLRWAISSTSSPEGLAIPFREAMRVASMFAGPVLDALETMADHPDTSFLLLMEKWLQKSSAERLDK